MAESDLPSLPPINNEIKQAIERKSLIVFLGSGVSMSGGLPSWEELAYNVIKKNVTCAQFDSIKLKKYSPRRLMSLARSYYTDRE